jgi:formylglycine-generating enzyme required for sulfatase activity
MLSHFIETSGSTMKSIFTHLLAVFFIAASLGASPAFAGEKGMLRIVTEPGDAQIFINGKRKGNSPAEAGQSYAIKLDEGEYSIQALKSDGGPKEQYGQKTVFVAEDSLQTITLALKERPSASFRENLKRKYGGRAIEPHMVALPAGSFTMGSPSSEPQRGSDEGPQHSVTIAAFDMAKHELTFDEWDACVADGGCDHWPEDEGWGRGKRPVIRVSWDDAQQYLAWLNKKTGKRYRLPSEAEWEYAARAGTSTRFSTGDCITTAQANFDGNKPAQGCPKGGYRKQTLPVGSFSANAWGLHDLHGNVWEWTQDCWIDSYSGTPDDGSARTDGDCSRRALRGGSWFYSGGRLRSAYRYFDSRDYRNFDLGFRLSRSR